MLAAIREEEKQHRNLAPAWGDVHNECADEWREAAEQLLALQAENAKLRKCVELYADKNNWGKCSPSYDTPDNLWLPNYDGCEPAQACLKKGGDV